MIAMENNSLKNQRLNHLTTGLVALLVCGAIIAYNFLGIPPSSKNRHSMKAQQMLKQVYEAQLAFQAGEGNGNFSSDLSSLGKKETTDTRYLSLEVVQAQNIPLGGFLLGPMKATPKTSDKSAAFSITAFPAERLGPLNLSGEDCFYIDQTGVIRHSGSPTKIPNANSPPVE
jgi:hypothetical protein